MNLQTIKARLQSLNTDKVKEVRVNYPSLIDVFNDNERTDIGYILHNLISVGVSDEIALYNREGERIDEQLIVNKVTVYGFNEYHKTDLERVIPVIKKNGELFVRLEDYAPFYLNMEVYDYLTSEEVVNYINSTEFVDIYIKLKP